MMAPQKFPQKLPQKFPEGFSLIELLVAMAIGLFLLAGLVTLMANSKKNYLQQDYSARLQENARFAMEFLSYDLRLNGYFGCSNDFVSSDVPPFGGDPALTLNDTVVPQGVNGSGATPDSVTVAYGEAYDLNDISETITITQVSSIVATPNVWVVNDIPQDWAIGDLVVASDCGSASLTRITGLVDATNTVTVANNLGRVFNPADQTQGPIVVRKLIRDQYAITDPGLSGVPVLTRTDVDGNAVELVEGVENMQLMYRDTASTTYGTTLSPDLQATQLGLLVRSVSNELLPGGANDREFGSGEAITIDDGNHSVLGQPVGAVTDPIRGQRRVFTNTLVKRNL